MYQFIKIHFISRYVIVSVHYLGGNGLLTMNERVDGLVYCPPAKQVVARHIVLLPYAVGTVFALTAVGIRPGQFDESHIGGSRERKAYTGRLDGADYQLHIGIVLEGIDGCLFVCRRVAPGDCNRFGEELQQLSTTSWSEQKTMSFLPFSRNVRMKSTACATLPSVASWRNVIKRTKASIRILRRISQSVHWV